MGLAATFILYLVIGSATTAAVLLREPAESMSPLLLGLSVLLFWPMYVPGLLSRPVKQPTQTDSHPADPESVFIALRNESEEQ